MLAGVVLIAGLTLIHGVQVGFYAPIAGDAQTGVLVPNSLEGQEYYHDALPKVADPADFFRRYNEIQPTLNRHSHTHPPGAVLTLYFLAKVLKDPALIALFIMITATTASVYFFDLSCERIFFQRRIGKLYDVLVCAAAGGADHLGN